MGLLQLHLLLAVVLRPVVAIPCQEVPGVRVGTQNPKPLSLEMSTVLNYTTAVAVDARTSH